MTYLPSDRTEGNVAQKNTGRLLRPFKSMIEVLNGDRPALLKWTVETTSVQVTRKLTSASNANPRPRCKSKKKMLPSIATNRRTHTVGIPIYDGLFSSSTGDWLVEKEDTVLPDNLYQSSEREM